MPPVPIPPQLRALRGNVGHQRITSAVGDLAPKVPPCPREFDAKSRRVWRAIGTVLARNGLITEVDGPAFAAFVASYSRWLQITALLKDAPIWVERADGSIEPNPSIRLQAEAQRDYLKALEGFGATPLWRGRITTKAASPADDLGEWLRKA